MTPDAAAVLAYMDANPKTSAKRAAEALGLPPSAAKAARKERNAARTRTRANLVSLPTPRPAPLDVVTAKPVQFWSAELRTLSMKREEAAERQSWVAYAQLTRQFHHARVQFEQAVAAQPPLPNADTDAELEAELAELLEGMPDVVREVVG